MITFVRTLPVLCALLGGVVSADVVTLDAVRDNTLYEDDSGDLSNGAGEHFFAGRTAQSPGDHLRRGLIAFDIAGSLPSGSVINSVTLTLNMSRTRGPDTAVGLHRVLSDWGEGASQAPGEEGGGASAEAGDATWIHTFWNTQFWANAGGDFVSTASATTTVGGRGSYNWSSETMRSEVETWLGDPGSNFGWLLLGDESQNKTTKRFDSRTNSNTGDRPVLTIDFTPPAQTGACCFTDGTCLILSQGECGSQGGTYQGNGTSCTPNDCPQPPGACCFNDGSCSLLTQDECDTAGGTFQGGNTSCIPNPCTLVLEPFVDPLPVPPVMQPTTGVPGGEATYDIDIVEFDQQLHRDLPPTRCWGYGGTYPSATIEAGRDLPVTLNFTNDLRDEQGNLRTQHYLPVDPCPHGADTDDPRTVIHLHGGYVSPENDGYPEDWFLPGQSDTYFYPNTQLPATIWFHDHALGITRLNVIMGLAGFYLIRDDFEQSLDLPADQYEIPLVIQDRTFNVDGTWSYPADWQGDFFGDTLLVNGKVWPFLNVDRGKYRFRVLNGSNSRTYTLALSTGDTFFQIGTDGGLLTAPVPVDEVTLMPGERADIVIDFNAYSQGTEVLLVNSAPAPFPGEPGVGVIPEVMKFIVQQPHGDRDPLPPTLRTLEVLSEQDAVEFREFTLKRETDPCTGVVWLINGLGWDDITEFPVFDTIEVWSFINRSSMAHPMHMHLVQFQVLDRQNFIVVDGEVIPIGDPIPPEPNEAGWKDTVASYPDQITRVIARFDGWLGKYPYHCHILEHEDHEMMRQFEVVAAGETICPDDPNDFLKLLGGVVSGDALDLCLSDDVRLDVIQTAQLSPLLPFIRLEYWAHATTADNPVTSLDYKVEGHVSALVAGGQNPNTLRTSIRNYAGGFEIVDQRGTSSNTDEIITHTQTTNAPDYVNAGDGEVRVRQEVFDPGSVFTPNWFLKVDLYEVVVNK